MADARHLVFITTPNDEAIWYDRLLESLGKLEFREPTAAHDRNRKARLTDNEQRCTIREATFAAMELIALEGAAGRVAAEPIGIYPPGIALVMPGERISKDAIEYLNEEEKNGGELFGVRNGSVFVSKEY
ncbi:Arginine decarboxylase [bioreactor metagenome]|uniref:Arginine decarboxylase n=1 Tax=bioreactor metagenome TaxID=1076179 RepID=A0A645EDD1_9ZZZZ